MHQRAYRLLSDSLAKKKAKKLVEIVELMGLSLKLSRAQEFVAKLMGYDNWSELGRVTLATPERGVPDQMLQPEEASERRAFQVALLTEEFKIDAFVAGTLLAALAPTGDGDDFVMALVEKLGLRLNDADVAWIKESMISVRAFDAAIRPLYRLSSHSETGLTHFRLESIVPGRRKFYNRQTTTPDHVVRWVAAAFGDDAPLAGEQLAEVAERAKDACQAFAELDARIRALGPAPMLAPVDWVFLMLFRARSSKDGSVFHTAINREPWLHIGFDLPGFCFNPENEWNATQALALQLALRREFLDAGWTGDGDEWTVVFREGNSARESMQVCAASAGAAYAWVAAARGAIRIAKRQTVSSLSLVSVVGPRGPANPEQALATAMNEPVIRRGKLLCGSKLKIRGQRKAA